MEDRRVVVTGLGVISPLGLDVEQTWQALIAGRSGVRTITAFDAQGSDVRIAAEIAGFDAAAFFGRRRARHLDRVVQLALVATKEAIESSKLDVATAPERTGVVYASGIGGIRTLEEGIRVLINRGAEWVNPYVVPMMIPNMAAGEIAMEWQLLGYNCCTVTACSASAHAIGTAFDAIRLGRADAMVCGGSEAAVTPVGIAGFAAMKALSTRNDEPERASRPWDKRRDGFVIGEGAGIVVLEELEHAKRRDAKIYAEVVGYGMSGDAHHITAPAENGSGAFRAMRNALKRGGLATDSIDYINAHGTSTPLGDEIELGAVKRLFGDHAYRLSMSSTKSAIGHLLGAAGSVEAIFSIFAMRDGIVPPTLNLEDPSDGCDIDLVPLRAKERRVRYVLSNSFGFGGTNASLIFAPPP